MPGLHALTNKRRPTRAYPTTPAASLGRGAGAIVISAAAIALFASGCGGGGDKTTPEPPDPSLVKSVNAACERYKANITHESQHFEATLHRAGAAGALSTAADGYRAAARRTTRLARRVKSIAGDQAPPELEEWI